MKIKNKYLRNRAFRNKHWKRIRNIEHPFETFCPYNGYGSDGYYYNSYFYSYDVQSQVERHFEDIERKVRALESGTHKQWVVWNASADFRRLINRQRKARDRNVMNKIRNGNYEVEFDKYHEDAAWYYF